MASNAQRIQGAGPTPGAGDPVDTRPAPGAVFPVSGSVSPSLDVSGTQTVGPTGGDIDIDVSGKASLMVHAITDGGWNSTIQIQLSVDGGLNYDLVLTPWMYDRTFDAGVRTQNIFNGPSSVFLATLAVSAMDHIRLAVPPSGGTIVLSWRASQAPFVYEDVGKYGASNNLKTHAVERGLLAWQSVDSQWQPLRMYRGTPDQLVAGETGLICESRNWLYNGSPFMQMQRTACVFKTVQAAAAGNTALWTPTLGTKFRLMRYMVEVTGNASFAAAALLTVSLLDGAAAMGLAHDVYVPLAAAIVPGAVYSSPWIQLDNGLLSSAANNVLNINLSAALATGNVRVIACGTEE